MKYMHFVLSPLTNIRHIRSRVSLLLVAVLLAVLPTQAAAAVPDPVLEWIGIMNTTVLAGGTSSLVTSRVVALVAGSIFDAVNGINPRYRPLHVTPRAQAGASQRGAAVQAAYAMLIKIYPAQLTALKAQRDASIALIKTVENPNSVDAGAAWGQTVANSIWEWRLLDGFAPPPPPFFGVASIVGQLAAVCQHGTLGLDTARAVPPSSTFRSHHTRVSCRL